MTQFNERCTELLSRNFIVMGSAEGRSLDDCARVGNRNQWALCPQRKVNGECGNAARINPAANP
jgi:hypothetical protein